MSRPPEHQAIHLGAKCAEVPETWQPRIVAELNGYHFKVARLEGDFIWHEHADTDEAFLVLAEPRGVVTTGSEGGERTAQRDLWI